MSTKAEIKALEKRLGRKLRPNDFLKDHPFNTVRRSPRLMRRQKRKAALAAIMAASASAAVASLGVANDESGTKL